MVCGMGIFTIYPKGEGDSFKVKLERFELGQDGRIILHNTLGVETDLAMLATDAIAAIIPEQVTPADWGKSEKDITYQVFLKGHTAETITIFAGKFKIADGLVQFFQLVEKTPDFEPERDPIPQIYVLASEVVGIVPEDGLPRRWHLEK
jgi:hypothetical protein